MWSSPYFNFRRRVLAKKGEFLTLDGDSSFLDSRVVSCLHYAHLHFFAGFVCLSRAWWHGRRTDAATGLDRIRRRDHAALPGAVALQYDRPAWKREARSRLLEAGPRKGRHSHKRVLRPTEPAERRGPIEGKWTQAAVARHGAYRCGEDRKSTRLNSSHGYISYAVFCLKKKKKKDNKLCVHSSE